MGSPSYYSGKGASKSRIKSSYSGKGSNKSRNQIYHESDPIRQVRSILEELDKKRQIVLEAELRLSNAKNDLRESEIKFQQKMESLTPETRDMIRSLLGLLDPDEKINVNTKGKIV